MQTATKVQSPTFDSIGPSKTKRRGFWPRLERDVRGLFSGPACEPATEESETAQDDGKALGLRNGSYVRKGGANGQIINRERRGQAGSSLAEIDGRDSV